MDEDLNWRVEEACSNAYPSPRELIYGGWLMRFSGGMIRRTGSVNPLRGRREKPRSVVDLAERLYGSLGHRPIFRIPQIADDLDRELDERNYDHAAGSAVLFCDLAAASKVEVEEVIVEPDMTPHWHEESSRIGALSDREHAIFGIMVATIVLPKAFASISIDGRVAAKAYGAIQDGLLVLEAVATDPGHRRRGHARKVVSGLMQWARTQGAEAACLQVLVDNLPALGLYKSLGFDRELYRYHYRMKLDAGASKRKP
ncbi:MAG: GNAT family N-acetyltransferase [Phyllobacterium sp.]